MTKSHEAGTEDGSIKTSRLKDCKTARLQDAGSESLFSIIRWRHTKQFPEAFGKIGKIVEPCLVCHLCNITKTFIK